MAGERQAGETWSLLSEWIKAASDFGDLMTKMAPKGFDPPSMPETGGKSGEKPEAKSRIQSSWHTGQQLWHMLYSIMWDPNVFNATAKGGNSLPEVAMKLAQSSWDSVFSLQKQVFERAGSISKQTGSYSFEDIDQNLFKAWAEIYDKELSKFFNVPQLGLARFYQERLARMLDKYNIAQTHTAEFLRVLYMPIEKATQTMQEKLDELTADDKLPGSADEYYKMWIKILEGHYMRLFQSEEYVQTIKKSMNSVQEFDKARQEAIYDLLKMFPVPTNKDMDELYKDLHTLKKRVRELERKEKERKQGQR